MTTDTKRGGHRGQGSCRGLAIHGTRADPHDQYAVVLAADAGTGRAGPDPDGNPHRLDVRPASFAAEPPDTAHSSGL